MERPVGDGALHRRFHPQRSLGRNLDLEVRVQGWLAHVDDPLAFRWSQPSFVCDAGPSRRYGRRTGTAIARRTGGNVGGFPCLRGAATNARASEGPRVPNGRRSGAGPRCLRSPRTDRTTSTASDSALEFLEQPRAQNMIEESRRKPPQTPSRASE